VMTEEQKMEQGQRMFSIFAPRMFEQRGFTACREKKREERVEREALRKAQEFEKAKKEEEKRKRKEEEKKRIEGREGTREGTGEKGV
ncbi:hypothetical protein GG344DRAFT_59850, partial [Lentinula edodes]